MRGWRDGDVKKARGHYKMNSMNRRRFLNTIGAGTALLALPKWLNAKDVSPNRPNILFCISDDQSWQHAGAYGDKVVKTPNFDRIAKEGVLFTHAFTAAPTCTPSRSAILTGQEIWRLEEGGVLFGTLPAKFKVYPDLLEQAGYFVGATGKDWFPGAVEPGGRTRNPAGPYYGDKKDNNPPTKGIMKCDYAANFKVFLKERKPGRPFCFWYGGFEPHTEYEQGSGLHAGKKLKDVKVPEFLPDSDVVRGDILDYYLEIEHFDNHLGRMIKHLEQAGELDNTIIVVTSDNGMPFPRAKATLYDYGTRMPLAIRWPARVKAGRVVDDFVSLTDMAPTFLEAAGLKVPTEMTGRSLMNVLLSSKSGRVDQTRDRVFTARERHSYARPNAASYPSRAIRTHQWLYIRNYEPDRWPAGAPDFLGANNGIFGEIDNLPTKLHMILHRNTPEAARLFRLAFTKRPAEELYDVRKDPYQMKNLAQDPAYTEVKKKLLIQLEQYLRDKNDPRMEGKAPWDNYPWYQGGKPRNYTK